MNEKVEISRPLRPNDIPYGVKDFKAIRDGGRYYVDKTDFIRRLEARSDFNFFVRPRRFGKSLLLTMLETYYDVLEKKNFQRYFGGLEIGKTPTDDANRYCVLRLDFSLVGKAEGKDWLEKFTSYIDLRLKLFIDKYADVLGNLPRLSELLSGRNPSDKFETIVEACRQGGVPPLYLLIDEYDNFTNEIIRLHGNGRYEEITHGEGFYRNWFKAFKEGCARIFMTGVSPVTMDDLTSGFNIATNISQDPGFNAMVGFTKDETARIFHDFKGVGAFVNDVEKHIDTVERWYDGYCFAEEKLGREHLFNCDMVFYYLSELVNNGRPPKNLVDVNIQSDWAKLKLVLQAQREAEFKGILPLTERLAEDDEVFFPLVTSFQIRDVLEKENFKSLYYYYGIVTMAGVSRGNLAFRIPNECVRRQVFEYMRDEYRVRGSAVDFTEFVRLFDAFAWDGEFKPLFKYLAERFEAYGSNRDAVGCEALINGFMRSYLTMKSVYMAKPELELNGKYCDYAFFPDWSLGAESKPAQSYVIELKYSKKDAPEAEIAAKHAEAIEQLARYSQDPRIPQLAAGTPVHYLDIEFVGRELRVCEEVAPMPVFRCSTSGLSEHGSQEGGRWIKDHTGRF